MKALLLSEYHHLEVADLPGPTTAPDEVLIEVRRLRHLCWRCERLRRVQRAAYPHPS